MSDVDVWFKDNDMVIEVSGVTDQITGAAVDDATILAKLVDGAGTNVPGVVWPVTVANVGTGLYRVTVDKAVTIVSGDIYTLIVDLATPGGADAHWEVPIGGEIRTA